MCLSCFRKEVIHTGKENNYTAKFKVDISDLKKNITEANKNIRMANAEFKAATAGMDDWKNSAEGINEKLKQLTKVLDSENAKLKSYQEQLERTAKAEEENSKRAEVLKKQYQEAAKQFGENSEECKKLQSALNAVEKEQEANTKGVEDLRIKILNQQATVGRTEKEFRNYQKQLENVENISKQAEGAAGDLSDSLKDVEGSAENATTGTEKLKEGFTVVKGVIASLIAEGIKKLSSEFVDLAKQAVNFSAEFESAMNTLQVQTGMSSKEMEKYNGIMKEMYNKNYGESFDDIAQSIATVAQNSKEVDPAKIQELTEGALTLRDAFGFEVNETMRAANMLMDQFGISGEEAYNLIAQGAQNGLNKNGDLLDTINEYAVHFKQTGLSAEDFFNMLENGAEKGTFSVDKLGDAWKEFGIRAKDTTNTTTEAYEILGLNADEMRAKFAAGGESAKQATDTILTALFSMDDAVKQNQAGVDLFGTMWEDLGADAIKALSDTNGEITTTKNSLEEINKVQYSGFEHELEQLKREFKTSLSEPLAEEVIPQVKKFFDTLKSSGSLQSFSNILGDVAGIFLQLANKLLPPALKLLEGILKNFKWLAPAVGAVVTAFLTYKKASKAVEGTNTVVGLLAKGISNVCGGIDLQIAKQTILNGLKSPWGALAVGVGTLITGLVVLAANMETESSLLRKQTEEAEANIKARQELIDKQNEQIATGLGEIEQTQRLSAELDTLVDANGRVKEGYENRAQFIIGELNEALGTEYELTDGQITKYDELKNQIDSLIEKKRAQIIVEAQEEAYKEAILKYQDKAIEKQDAYNEKIALEAEIEATKDEQLKGSLIRRLENVKKHYDAVSREVEGYYNDIMTYERNATLLASDNAEDWKKIQTNITATASNTTNAKKEQLQQQLTADKDYLEQMKTAYAQTNDETLADMIKTKEESIANTQSQLDSMTGTVNAGSQNLLSAWRTNMDNSVNAVSEKSPFFQSAMAKNVGSVVSSVFDNSWKVSDALGTTMTDGEQKIKDEKGNFETSGNWIMEGLKSSINNGSRGVLGAIGGVASALVKRFNREMGIKSPSKVMASAAKWIPEGVSKGIKDNSKVAVNQMKGFAVQMIDTAKTTLKDGKLSDAFGAEIQSATDMINKINLGSKAAGVLAGTNHNLSSGTSLGYIGGASQSMQKEYNFYQNNYSPKALSRFDIYRQSKNLLSQARRV